MITTFVWTNGRGKIVHTEKDYKVVYKEGYETVGCQCYKDCTCAQDNKIKNVKIFRVTGKNRRDWIPKPYNFNTLEDAINRIKQLKNSQQ